MNEYLEKIINFKKEIALERKKYIDEIIISNNNDKQELYAKRRDFKREISKKFSLIGEIKKASPSSGLIIKGFYDYLALAMDYQTAGAAAISVLTEELFFKGDLSHVIEISGFIKIPILRKDFIVELYQIKETKIFQADATLLIVSILTKEQIKEFYELAKKINLDLIFEVHSFDDLEKILPLKPEIIGINSRNLDTLEIDTNIFFQLKNLIPETIITIAESGIEDKELVEKVKKAGFNAVLVGTSIMKSNDIKAKVKELGF